MHSTVVKCLGKVLFFCLYRNEESLRGGKGFCTSFVTVAFQGFVEGILLLWEGLKMPNRTLKMCQMSFSAHYRQWFGRILGSLLNVSKLQLKLHLFDMSDGENYLGYYIM